MHGATIGRGSTIAVGAVVMEHVHAPEFSLIAGSPAKIKTAYNDPETCLARAAKHAHQYCARASVYRRSLREMLDQPEGTGCRQWEPAAWEEAAARLGYPRLFLEGRGDKSDNELVVQHHSLSESTLTPDDDSPMKYGGEFEHADQSPEAQAPFRLTGNGVASTIIAAAAGAVASVVVTALRRRRH